MTVNFESRTLFDPSYSLEHKKKQISAIDPPPLHLKQFALIHGDTFISHTPYEGGNISEQIQYAIDLHQFLQTSPSLFPVNLNHQKQILEELKIAQKVYLLFQNKDLLGLYKLIQNSLKERGRISLPLIHQGLVGSPGHAFVCVIEQKIDRQLIVRLLNKGESSETHDPGYSSLKFKYSPSFNPILLKKDHYFDSSEPSKVIHKLLTLLISYYHSECPDYHIVPSSFEIYHLFLLLGKPLAGPRDSLSVTSQRSGTCPEQVVRLIEQDFLCPDSHSQEGIKTYKRLQFAKKFYSLLAISHQEIDRENYFIINQSTHDFGVSFEKLFQRGVLNEQEFLMAYTLFEEVKSVLEKNKNYPPFPSTLPKLEGAFFTKVTPSHDFFLPAPIPQPSQTAEKNFLLFDQSRPKPSDLFHRLKAFKEGQEYAIPFLNFVSNLPIPSFKNDPYWEKVDPSFAIPVLIHLNRLQVAFTADYQIALLHQLTLLAIADKLLQGVPKMALNQFAPYVPLEELPTEIFYAHGEDAERFEQLKKYFQKREKNTPLIFHFTEEKTFLDEAIEELNRNDPQSKVAVHLSWINQIYQHPLTFQDPKARYLFLLNTETATQLPLEYKFYESFCRIAQKLILHYFCYDIKTQTLIPSFAGLSTKEGFLHLKLFRQEQKPTTFNFRLFPPKKYSISNLLEQTKDRNENDLLLKKDFPEKMGSLDSYVLHDLLKTIYKEELVIASLIEFLTEHFHDAETEDFQNVVEWCLFQDQKLIKKIQKDPHIIPILQEAVENHIQYCLKPDFFSSALFWLRLAFHIETHFAKGGCAYDPLPQLQKILSYLEHLKTLCRGSKRIEYDLLVHELYFKIHLPNQNLETLLSDFQLMNFVDKQNALTSPWIHQKVIAYFEENGLKIRKMAEEDPDFTLRIMQPLFKRLHLDPKKLNRETDKPHIFKNQDFKYTVCLEKGSLYMGSELLQVHGSLEKDFEALDAFGPFRIKWIKLKNREYLSEDGLFRISDSTFLRKFPSLSDEYFYLRGNFSPFSFRERTQLWRSPSIKEDLNFFIITDWVTKRPIAEVSWNVKTNEIEVRKLSPQGFRIPNGEALLFYKSEEFPLAEFLENLMGKDFFYFWGDPESLTLKTIESPKLGLEFRVESDSLGVTRVWSTHFKEYRLSSEQSLPFLGYLKGALILEREGQANKKIAILKAPENECGHYSYELNPRTGKLRGHSPAANFNLIAFLFENHRFEEAASYIEDLQPDAIVSDQDWKVISNIVGNKNESPASTGTKLKLFIKLIDCHYSLQVNLQKGGQIERELLVSKINKQKNSKKLKSQPNFLQVTLLKIFGCYEKYFTFQSDPDCNAIPFFARISKEEEVQLINFIEKIEYFSEEFHKSVEGSLFLMGRKKTLFSKDYNLIATIPFKIDTLPRLLKKLIHTFPKEAPFEEIKGGTLLTQNLLSDPIPIRGNIDLNAFYYTLLNQALAADSNDVDPFDLQIIPLYYSFQKHTHFKKMLAILILVRLYPNDFKELFAKPFSLQEFYHSLVDRAHQRLKQIGEFKAETILNKKHPLKKFIPKVLLESGLTEATPLNPKGSKGLEFSEFPLKSLFEQFFIKTIHSEYTPFFLSRLKLEVPLPQLAQKLLQELSKAHVPNTYERYEKLPTTHIHNLQEALKKKLFEIEIKKKKMEEEILQIANYPSDDQFRFLPHEMKQRVLLHRLRKKSRQKKEMTLENEIIHSLLFKDSTFLIKYNPFLTQIHIHSINLLTISYMQLGSIQNQLNEALSAMDEKRNSQEVFQEVAKILDKRRDYNPQEYPHYLVYEYASQKILRKDQVELLKRIEKLLFSDSNLFEELPFIRRLFIEFKAAGGKTKILSVLLALLALQQGKLPIFFTWGAIHDITLQDFKSALWTAFQIKTEEIKYSLDTRLSLRDLELLARRLKEYKKGKKALVMTPETFHSLQLDYQNALDIQDGERIQRLETILVFLEQESIFQVDEAHLNLDSLFQANLATGIPSKLPQEQLQLVLWCYHQLLGIGKRKLFLPDNREVSLVLGLRENKQALCSQSDKKAILEVLAETLLEKLPHPRDSKSEFLNYLKNKSCEPPEWLLNLYLKKPDQAKLIGLARGLLLEILPHALDQVEQMNYGPGTSVEIPYRLKTPSSSKFENPDITVALSIQGLYQRGLNLPEQMQLFIQSLQKEVAQEKKIGEKTSTEREFLEWQKGMPSSIELMSITPQMLQDGDFLKLLLAAIGKKEAVIERYLFDHVFPYVYLFPDKWVSPTANLFAKKSIYYSATLGTKEKYPLLRPLDGFWEDAAFVSSVCQKICLSQNRNVFWLEDCPPLQFFEAIFKDCDIEGIIDVGGWSKNLPNEQWAKDFVGFVNEKKLNFDGSIFAKEVLKNNKSEKVLHLLLKEGEPVSFYGSDLPSELERLGLREKRFFKIYGASETTGMDIPLPRRANLVVTLGENLTLSALSQAILRMRGFLQGDFEQYLILVGSLKLQEVIRSTVGGDSVEHILLWTLINEANMQEKAILARGTQEIQIAIRSLIKKKGRKAYSPEERIEIFKRHEKAFKHSLDRDPFILWGFGSRRGDTGKILQMYAKTFAMQSGLSQAELSVIQSQVDEIIDQTVNLIPEIPERQGIDFSATLQQHFVQKREQKEESKQEQKNISTQTLTAIAPLPYASQELSLRSFRHFSESPPYCRKACVNFKSILLSENLYIAENVLKTFRENGFQMKPIHRLLVVEENQKFRVFLISLEDAEVYLQQLNDPTLHRKAALFTRQGILEKASSSFPDISKEEWFQEMLNEVALLNGKIRTESFIKKLCSENSQEISHLWSQIMSARALLDPQALDHSRFNRFHGL